MKFCNKCYTCKDHSKFSNQKKDSRDGKRNSCKECDALTYIKSKMKAPPLTEEQLKERRRKAKERYYQNHEFYRSREREYKNKLRETDPLYREKCRTYARRYKELNKESVLKTKREYYKKNAERLRQKSNEAFKRKDKEKYYKRVAELHKINMQKNPLYKLRKSLRGAIYNELKQRGKRKTKKTEEILGIPAKEVKKHLERQFKKGMNWSNYGKTGWHIDHIIPISSAKTEEELIKLFHYTNLQPMWAKENMEKGSKILEVQLKITI